MPNSSLNRTRNAAARSATFWLLGAFATGLLSACGGDKRSVTAVEITTPTTGGPVTGGCTALTMSVGSAVTIAGTTVCLSGGALGSEYAIVPFNSSTAAAARSTFDVQPTGIISVTSTLAEVPAAGLFGSSSAKAAASGPQTFEAALRVRERAALVSRAGGARSWFALRNASGGARLNVIPGTATVGDLVSLNANADDACSKPSIRAARIVAVGRKALIVADTLNPAGGFTQADYAAVATTFDDVVDPINIKAFGEPSDIDGNGRVVLFFTSAVNALTPKEAGYYVGGFFYGRDLLPTSGTSPAGVCAASNAAEMFYLFVPDPSGDINGNVFSKDFVSRATVATVAHEYQHLINASRRLYVNTGATDFEDTWLDEGLAHMAEELLFYGRSGLTERSNIDATLVRSNETFRLAFNSDGIGNFGRFRSFLSNPPSNSPYADNDSLATRGATWAFLRYAIDQQSASQETVLSRLVNSTTTGLANLRVVFGTDLTPLFRDWANALILDDVTGAATRYQFRSWNMRSILGALDKDGLYQLATQSLVSGEAKTVSLAGGGAAYLRFGVAAGGTGSLSWTAPSGVQTTVVRLR